MLEKFCVIFFRKKVDVSNDPDRQINQAKVMIKSAAIMTQVQQAINYNAALKFGSIKLSISLLLTVIYRS